MSKENLEKLLPEIRALQGAGQPDVDDSEARASLDDLRALVERELKKRWEGKYISKAMLPEVSKTLTKAVAKKFPGATVELKKSRSGEIELSVSMSEED